MRALRDAGVRLRGDVMIAAVCGEIEKTQQGDAQGAEYRGYAAGSRYLVGHGGAADMCILGEPTENKLVLAHFGALWLRLAGAAAPFIHTAFSEGRREENSIVRMRGVLDACSSGCRRGRTTREWVRRRREGVANVGAIQGGFGWRASRTPHAHRSLPRPARAADVPMARRGGAALECGARCCDGGVEARGLRDRAGARDRRGAPARAARSRRRTRRCSAREPERDVTRWFSDASVLTRYGIETVNYGTSSGLPDAELGENLAVDGLVKTAEVYARAAMRVCGVAE